MFDHPNDAPEDAPPSLEAVRARIDAIDTDLLTLLDERAALARAVAEAKRASGQVGFGLRPARESQVLRRLLAQPRRGATPGLVVRVWRELMAESLMLQGPFQLSVWGGKAAGRTVELARGRFGAAPPLTEVASPELALAAAQRPGGVAVLALEPGSAWWARLLAQPQLRVFAVLPCLQAWGPPAALAVAQVEVEPSGGDETLFVADDPGPTSALIARLSVAGLAAELLAEGGGLKLLTLAGYVQPTDERLARAAPGRLSGVIGAAPAAFDL